MRQVKRGACQYHYVVRAPQRPRRPPWLASPSLCRRRADCAVPPARRGPTGGDGVPVRLHERRRADQAGAGARGEGPARASAGSVRCARAPSASVQGGTLLYVSLSPAVALSALFPAVASRFVQGASPHSRRGRTRSCRGSTDGSAAGLGRSRRGRRCTRSSRRLRRQRSRSSRTGDLTSLGPVDCSRNKTPTTTLLLWREALVEKEPVVVGRHGADIISNAPKKYRTP